MLNIKRVVLLVVVLFISIGIMLGQFMTDKIPRNVLKREKVTQQAEELENNTRQWKKEWVQSDYKIVPSYNTKQRYNIQLLVAKGGYSLAKVEDISKLLLAQYSVKDGFVIFRKNKKEIKLKIEEPILIGYTTTDNGVLKRAQFKIPYPARKINSNIYVPVRSVFRAFGYGIRFDRQNGIIYFGRDIKVDDMCLIFDKFVEEKVGEMK